MNEQPHNTETSSPSGKSMGFMYVAKKPCGKVVAAGWDDDDRKVQAAKSASGWKKRGLNVERVERFEGDHDLVWASRDCRNCGGACAAQNRNLQ